MAGHPAALAFAGAWGLGGLAGWLGVGLAYGWLMAGQWQACFSSIVFIWKKNSVIVWLMGLLAYWLRELARSQAGAEYAQNSFLVVNEFPSNSKFGLYRVSKVIWFQSI